MLLQSHSTCFGLKRPSSGVFKTGTAATGTCVIVVGQPSHFLIRAGTECFCRVSLHVSGVKRPSSGVFKTSTAATGTCVIAAGKSSHLLIRAELNASAESLYMFRASGAHH